MAQETAELGRLLRAADAHTAEIARQRELLRQAWQPATEEITRLQAQQAGAREAYDTYRARYLKLLQKFTALSTLTVRPEAAAHQVPAADPGTWLQQVRYPAAGWAVTEELRGQFDSHEASAGTSLHAYSGRLFGGRHWNEGIRQLEYLAAWLTRVRELGTALEGSLQRATAGRARTCGQARAAADSALTAARALTGRALGLLPAPLQPWDFPAWSDWAPATAPDGLDLVYAGRMVPLDDGDLGDNAGFGSGERPPFFMSLRQNLELSYSPDGREQAVALARNLLLRQFAATPPGDMRMCFLDPVGLGQSVAEFLGLGEYDPELIGGKAWSAPGDLAARLTELTAHIELVIQKYLRTTYETIDEFNAAAGEIAEPYRYLVVCDFPAGFTDESFGRLKSVMANGPRCGVRTLLLTSQAVSPAHGVQPAQLAGSAVRINIGTDFRREQDGYTLKMRLQDDADAGLAARLAVTVTDAVGRQAVSRTEAAVTFEKAMSLFSQVARRGLRTDLPPAAAAVLAGDEATWWQADSTRGLFAPVGQKGARDAAIASFDSGDHAGALLVGRPGSGKSTLLHTLVAGLTTLYGPGELELYLIDFKEGVEFKAYAEEALPHARMVAIESDREFGLSVLQSLEAELARRGELLRATGGRHAGLQALREATGQPLPRVLLVFDEFQVLFARNDKLGLAAASLLETVIRQGRGFGIHVLLGSQSLSGLDALGAHVPQLLPVRILLPATEADGRKVLGEGNDAGQYLVTHGEGILNAAGGAVEANERFKGALLTEPDRIARLRWLRAMADAAGFTRRPVVFEGNAQVPLDAVSPGEFRASLAGPAGAAAPVRLRAGVPMSAAAGGDIELRREAGANVLAVVRDPGADGDEPAGGPAFGLLAAGVAAAALTPARIDVIDFLPAGDGTDELLEPLLDRGRVTLRRRRAFLPLMEELRKEVRDRLQQDDLRRPARITFLFGVHRARDLDASFGSVDADPEVAEALEEVLRDGPEAGVHTWIWADTVTGASRRLSARMIRECAWRVAGKLSADDSMSLLGTDRAAEIRDRQLVLGNDDRGVLSRLMCYAPPGPAWLGAVLGSPPAAGPPVPAASPYPPRRTDG